jgi:hypothetical protein
MWRLALAGDSTALRRVAATLGDVPYDAHRARAFALAVDGRAAEALAELEAGSGGGWPFPPARAADAARVHYLAGDDDAALEALREALPGTDRVDPAAAELVRLVARRSPRLRRRAVAVALGGGSTWQRLRNAARTLR